MKGFETLKLWNLLSSTRELCSAVLNFLFYLWTAKSSCLKRFGVGVNVVWYTKISLTMMCNNRSQIQSSEVIWNTKILYIHRGEGLLWCICIGMQHTAECKTSCQIVCWQGEKAISIVLWLKTAKNTNFSIQKFIFCLIIVCHGNDKLAVWVVY